MESPKLTDEQLKKIADAPPEVKEKLSGTCAFRVGDEVNFGPCRFRVQSFGAGAVVLNAQPGTHIVRRK